MSMFSNLAIAQMRETLLASYEGRVTRLSKSVTNDERGGRVVTYTPNGKFPCHLSSASVAKSFGVALGQVTEGVTHYITYPFDQELNADDRLLIDGRTFEITGITKSTTNLNGRALLIEMVTE